MKKKKTRYKAPRNKVVLASFNNEVNLSTKIEADKTKYSRKTKHKTVDFS